MNPEIRELVFSIRSLESELESKRSQLQDIRRSCDHVWEVSKTSDKGEVLFEIEICKICGETKKG